MLLGGKAVTADKEVTKGPGLNMIFSLILFQVGLTPKLVPAKQSFKFFLNRFEVGANADLFSAGYKPYP